MRNILMNIVHVEPGKNPSAEQLAMSMVTKKPVLFAYEMSDPQRAGEIRRGPKGMLPVVVTGLHGGAPGAFIMHGLLLEDGYQPIKVEGTFTPEMNNGVVPTPSSGKLELYVR